MRFRRQLYIGLGALIALITTMAATGILALHVTSRGENALILANAEDITVVQRLQLLIERVVAASRGYLLSGDQIFRQQFDDTKQELEHLLAQQRGSELATVDLAARVYLRAATDAVDRRAKLADAGSIIPFFDRTLVADTVALDRGVSELARQRRAVFEAALGNTRAIVEHAQIALVLSSVLAISCGLALAFIVSRRLSDQFRRVERATEAANRAAAARKEILAIVAHDLRNPLNAITMGASLVQDTTREEGTRTYTRTIHHASERMQHMIEQLLETAQIDSGQLALRCEPVLARDLIVAAVDLFRTKAAERKIELCMVVHGGTVHADSERAIEVLSNLIGNALKFAGAAARVTVRAETQGPYVRFAVEDEGPGIPLTQLPCIFDRYWRGNRDRARDGLGLGLHICKWLVEAHKGTIGVNSVVGQGSTFWFDLPAAERP